MQIKRCTACDGAGQITMKTRNGYVEKPCPCCGGSGVLLDLKRNPEATTKAIRR